MNSSRTTRPGPVRSNPLVFLCRARAWLAVTALTWLCAGCPATGDEIRPPRDQLYFPTGMDISPDQRTLFVANANSDLRYDSGAIEILDLNRIDDLIEQWLTSGQPPDGTDCEVDLAVPYTLVCDESEAIRADGGVRIGNFATELKVQTLEDEGALRLFVAVRGDPSLTWVDYDVEERTLYCGEDDDDFPECDEAHRLLQIRDDEDLPTFPDEPFGLFVDSQNGYAVVTHLSNAAVSLANAPPNGDTPVLTDAIGNLFQFGDDGQRGAVGTAGRLPGSANDRIYVTSRRESRVQTLVVTRAAGFPQLIPTEFFFMRGTVGPSSDGRGIAFSADGERAYIVNRFPAMLHVFDTSLDVLGVPRNEFVASVELCSEASNLTVAPTERGDRIFVACFRNGQIWSIDPRGAVVDSIIEVGRGPHALVVAPERNRLYVTNNLESTVAVVDLTPETETENRVVLRIGRPRSAGEEEE
jgi:DNA-binding beta-propeller fold protein YncE